MKKNNHLNIWAGLNDPEAQFKALPKEHQDYWNKQPTISYKLNSHGFRSDEFSEEECRESITFLGCSNTYGSHLHKENTWSYLVANELNLKEINLGICAGSLDSAFRVYNEWQPIHKSKITCLFIPPGSRMEMIRLGRWNNIGQWTLDRNDTSVETRLFIADLLSDISQEVRTDRNIAAIKYIAQETQSKLIVMKYDKAFLASFVDKARDGVHPGPKSNRLLADKFIEAIGEL
jgi:hypothetical protein